MKKEKCPVKIVSDEKDFSAVLDIITTHRSRALMSVNVESLLTYWEIGASSRFTAFFQSSFRVVACSTISSLVV